MVVTLSINLDAAQADELENIRAKANSGDYEVALNMAHQLLETTPGTEKRYETLLFVFETEYLRSSLHGFDNIQKVEDAFASIRREFPERLDLESWLWKMAWIEWKGGKQKRAVEIAADLLRRYPSGPYSRDAILLMARVYLERGELEMAERYVLKLALLGSRTAEQKIQMKIFEMLINARRSPSKAFEYARQAWSDGKQVIERDPFLFYSLIRIWAQNGKPEDIVKKVEDFLSRYVEEDEVPYVNLIYGDVLYRLGLRKKSQFVYAVLAERHPETVLGKKAFLRGLMVEYEKVKDEARLLPVIRSMARLERDNQLTEIEIEAGLDQAILYARLARSSDHYILPALVHFAFSAKSDVKPFSDISRIKGKEMYLFGLGRYLENHERIKAITVWKRFSMFQTKTGKYLQVATGVALAYADMGVLDQAEALLMDIQRKSSGSLWADRNFLEQARIWLKRHDTDGVSKVMNWLAQHESTIYRSELLIIASRMYAERGDSAQAFQNLKQVDVLSLDEGMQMEYWRVQAELLSRLDQWGKAAEAWSRVVKLAKSSKDRNMALYEQATAWLKGGEYDNAVRLYEAIPESVQDDAWAFHSAQAQMYAGEVRTAETKFRALAQKSSRYALLARLELAARLTSQLKEHRP